MSFLGNIVSSVIGGYGSKRSGQAAQKAAEDNINFQKQFAQHGIRWKVADAKAAGIHPLAALGASTHSFQPVSVGQPSHWGSDVGRGLGRLGQDITRAMAAKASLTERRMMEIKLKQEEAILEGIGLSNEQKRRDIRGTPPLPDAMGNNTIVGQGDTVGAGTVIIPNRITSSKEIGMTSGVGPAQTLNIMPNGRVIESPPQKMAEGLENWYDQVDYALEKGGDLLKGYLHKRTGFPRSHGDTIERRRRALGTPPPGHYYRYEGDTNAFYLTKKRKRKTFSERYHRRKGGHVWPGHGR